MKTWAGLGLLVSLVAVSCSSPAVVADSVSFSSPAPPDEFASGLTIGFIPEGFAWVWNEGHETATFHTFQTEDESSQLSVGIQVSPPPHPGSGAEVSRAGRQFVVFDLEREIRVTEAVGNGVRLDVVSASLDRETLLRVAESVTYKPTATATTAPGVAAGGLVVPDCNDTASCAAGFILDDGVFYDLGCRAVRDAEVTPEVLGRGQLDGESVTVNAIEGIDRAVMVAVSLPGGLCGEGDQPLSRWTGAFPSTIDDDVLREAVCSAGEMTEAQRIADDC